MARYVAAMAGELSRLASAAGLDLAAYLLDMAQDEADAAVGGMAKPVGGRDGNGAVAAK